MGVPVLKSALTNDKPRPQRGEPNHLVMEKLGRQQTPQTPTSRNMESVTTRKISMNEFYDILRKEHKEVPYDTHTMEHLQKHWNTPLLPQMDMQASKQVSTHEVATFYDGNEIAPAIEKMKDFSRSNADTNAELDNFFSRPVRIYTQTWDVGASLEATINPWDLYFSNARVSNRINNYKLLRGNLNVKVVINGNGFYYGRAMVSYHPLAGYDEFGAPASQTPSLVVESQRQKIIIDPTQSTGGEMVLPFMWIENNLDLTIPNTFTNLGSLTLRSFNPLRHANQGTTALNISIFAWMDDISLNCPTNINASVLTPQMALEEVEANNKGVISGPATAVARVAGVLKNIPFVSGFATATEMAANITATLAKMFGYSRPIVTKCPEPYQPRVLSNLANVTVPDSCSKLTLDDKQSLALGHKIAGGSEEHDEFAIVNIGKRESFVTTFDWLQTNVVDAHLFAIRPSPVMFNIADSASRYIMSPSCVASLPFDTWTGTTFIRFQVVCSSLHKGRLKITYDPVYVDDLAAMNTSFTRIVDIATETDFTIAVAPAMTTKYLLCAKPGFQNPSDIYSTTPLSSAAVYGNGVLTVSVLNPLTATSSVTTADIQVNVYTSMGEDFHLQNPTLFFQDYTYFEATPQMGLEVVNETAMVNDKPKIEQINEWNDIEEHDAKLYYGEDIRSMRSLMKRYILWSSEELSNVVPPLTPYISLPFQPYLRGAAPNAIDTATGFTNVNRVAFPVLTLMQNCFAGWRGSIRYKAFPLQDCDLTVQRANAASNYINTDVDYTRASGGDWNKYSIGSSGMAITSTSVNKVLEYEMPYYSRYRFTPGRQASITVPSNPSFLPSNHELHVNGSLTGGGIVQMYVAAGEDFECYNWIGSPPMYFSTLPAP